MISMVMRSTAKRFGNETNLFLYPVAIMAFPSIEVVFRIAVASQRRPPPPRPPPPPLKLRLPPPLLMVLAPPPPREEDMLSRPRLLASLV
jgi:hypothetical protein